MKRLIFKATLPDPLFSELETAAKQTGCSPAEFCAEALEGVLASRRLPYVPPSPHGARIAEHAMVEHGLGVEILSESF